MKEILIQTIITMQRLMKEHKKKLVAVLICTFLLSAAVASAKYALEVEGVVTSANGHILIVTNQFTSRTIDFSTSPLPFDHIQRGDKVKIKKNIQGIVISLKVKKPFSNEKEHAI